MTTRRTIAHLLHQISTQPDQTGFYYHDGNDFVPVQRSAAREISQEMGMGFWALGMRPGDRVAIMSETRHEWELIDSGSLEAGYVVVAIYPTSTIEQICFILNDSGSKIAVVENATQWERVSSHLAELPELEHVVVIDSQGMLEENGLSTTWQPLEQIRELGRRLLAKQPQLLSQARETVQPTNLAGLVYTSGTTGMPKGVMLTHQNLYSVAEAVQSVIPLQPGDAGVTYLPMSHILQRVNGYYSKMAGLVGYYAPAITELVSTCLAANPRAVSGVPRVYEKIHARIMAGMAQAPPEKREQFHSALAVGLKRARLLHKQQPVPDELEAQYAQLDRAFFCGLRASIFGTNIEWLNSGAAPISYELLEFYHAIGLPIMEGYGLTETSSPITLNLVHQYKMGTVGRPLPRSSVKIGDDGEILLKGPGVFGAYYNNEQATADAFTEDGWFRSGDIGEVDADGYVKITDRKKSLTITAGGKNIPPAPIENRLMEHPLIGQVVVHGDMRRYLVALFTLDPEGAAAWAIQQGKAVHGDEIDLETLAEDTELQVEIAAFVETVNADLAQFETIKYFHIAAEEFTPDNGLLTPTLKIRRKVVEERYRAELDGLYGAG